MKSLNIKHNRCEVTYEQISKFQSPENTIEFLTTKMAEFVDFKIMCQIIDGRIKLDSKQRKSVKDYLYKIIIKN